MNLIKLMKSLIGRLTRRISQRFLGTMTHVETEEAIVALTFDDGPDPETTPALLKILQAHGAKATFFMTGEHAAAYPDIVADVRNAGHAIGNHSWNHPSFPLISRKERKAQIKRCAKIQQVDGMHMFRPPYGHQSAQSQMEAWLDGYHVITWNICVPDWEPHPAAWFEDFVLKQISAGSIILMHDGLVDSMEDPCSEHRTTVEAVERIMSALNNRYEFVTVPELLRRGKPIRENWWMKPDVSYLNQLKRKNQAPRRYESQKPLQTWLGFNR